MGGSRGGSFLLLTCTVISLTWPVAQGGIYNIINITPCANKSGHRVRLGGYSAMAVRMSSDSAYCIRGNAYSEKMLHIGKATNEGKINAVT